MRSVTAIAEAVAAVGAAALVVQLSRSVVVDPLDRIGQVSGLAGLDLRFLLLAVPIMLLVAAASRRAEWRPVAFRLGCAVVAGLATGLVAAGILLALKGTQWPLFADSGDSGRLAEWAAVLRATGVIPVSYPPGIVHLMAWVSDWSGMSTSSALRWLQIAGTALFGPVAYLGWRLVLGPGWALAVTLAAAVPLLDPYKPHTAIVLVALVPLLIATVSTLRRSPALGWARILATGAAIGISTGLLFLLYYGWFLWSFPGLLVAGLALFPWRRGAARGAVLLLTVAATFLLVTASHLVDVLTSAGSIEDAYFYFDTYVDPAYISMWLSDLPGDVGQWPPPGELGGVGVFTALLVVGLGAAVGLAGRSTTVIVACSLMTGAWLMRLWLASQMYETQAVQLYPRTAAQILFCLLVLSVLAVKAGHDRIHGRIEDTAREVHWPRARDRAADSGLAQIGVLTGAVLLALSMGSSIADRYMPRNDDSVGMLAYVSQMVRQPDGRCPAFSAPDRCVNSTEDLMNGIIRGGAADVPLRRAESG
jgi:galactan 5-O-arabinofuranosyltransferase